MFSPAESLGFQGPGEVTSRLGQAGAGSVLSAFRANEGRAWNQFKKGCTRAEVEQGSPTDWRWHRLSSLEHTAERWAHDQVGETHGRSVPYNNKK